jgi:hypothetical protein
MADVPTMQLRAVGSDEVGILNQHRRLIPITRRMPGRLKDRISFKPSRGRPVSHPNAASLTTASQAENRQAD